MSKAVKAQRLKVISVCSECGVPVCSTAKDNAYRHGYNRHVMTLDKLRNGPRRRLQEDGKSCAGSGQPVVYKRVPKK